VGALARELAVNPERDMAEVARFFSRVVAGPGRQDCWLWTGAIGDDGYGRNRAELHPVRLKATSC